ncbi:hypothetical protein [Brevibacillus sp. H7]|uniref:hypothetical protein n=1 Tax=Brevibacillus sp. H7 TaxID=3349138 RepID=UPI00382DD601
MDELLMLLSMDDLSTFLVVFAGFLGSVFSIALVSRPRTFRVLPTNTQVDENNINPRMVETYPAAARQALFRILARRARHPQTDEAEPLSVLLVTL